MESQIFTKTFMAVDTISYEVNQPKDRETRNRIYSGRHKQYELKYEVGVHLVSGVIYWVSAAFTGSVHDWFIFRNSRIKDQLLNNEYVLADKGYLGDNKAIIPFRGRNLADEQIHFNKYHCIYRSICERAFARIKSFRICSSKFRHNLQMHPLIFQICAKLCNLLLYEHPFSYVESEI